jgi:hypothetical protein
MRKKRIESPMNHPNEPFAELQPRIFMISIRPGCMLAAGQGRL